jgi:hypothetical protein
MFESIPSNPQGVYLKLRKLEDAKSADTPWEIKQRAETALGSLTGYIKTIDQAVTTRKSWGRWAREKVGGKKKKESDARMKVKKFRS